MLSNFSVLYAFVIKASFFLFILSFSRFLSLVFFLSFSFSRFLSLVFFLSLILSFDFYYIYLYSSCSKDRESFSDHYAFELEA
jgi:Zn-dependent protease with chaperone function